MVNRPDDTPGDDAQQKERWERPEVTSLDAPEVEGGTIVGSHETYHFPATSRGSRPS